VRYRYYVSQAVLQKKSGAAPEVKRVSAPHIEVLVVEQICRQLEIPPPLEAEEVRDLIECNLNRVVVTSKGARIHFVDGRAHHADANDKHTDFEQNGTPPLVEIDVDWKSPNATAAKGITRAPVEQGAMAPCVQEAMLGAIAKARLWVDELTTGRVGSFHDIARRENKGEKYVRALTALAFASPRMVQMIAAGRVERDLTVTSLVQNLPDSWRQQSKLISNR
jgi:hypothetical protein